MTSREPMTQEEFEFGIIAIIASAFGVLLLALIGGIVLDLIGWYDTFGGML